MLFRSVKVQKIVFKKKQKPKVELYFESRPFNNRDRIFWSSYGISKQNLIDDKVFPIRKYLMRNTKNGHIKKRVYDIGYAYTDFQNNRKKMYFPYREGKRRFISTCNKNDIGGIENLPQTGERVIITKSYKDYRVLKNQGLECIWIQNEGMIPDKEVLIPIIQGYSDIIIWYDNDTPGKEASIKMVDFINSILKGKCRSVCLSEELLNKHIKDPSDLIKHSKEKLTEFIDSYVKGNRPFLGPY